MTGVSDPKMKKSYHSNAVPADEAVTTRAIDHGFCCCLFVHHGLPLARRDSRSAARCKRVAKKPQSSLVMTSLTCATVTPNLRIVMRLTERAPVGLERQHLFGLEPALHRVVEQQPIAVEPAAHRAGIVGDRPGQRRRRGRAQRPSGAGARACCLRGWSGRGSARPCRRAALAFDADRHARPGHHLERAFAARRAGEEVERIEGRRRGGGGDAARGQRGAKKKRYGSSCK